MEIPRGFWHCSLDGRMDRWSAALTNRVLAHQTCAYKTDMQLAWKEWNGTELNGVMWDSPTIFKSATYNTRFKAESLRFQPRGFPVFSMSDATQAVYTLLLHPGIPPVWTQELTKQNVRYKAPLFNPGIHDTKLVISPCITRFSPQSNQGIRFLCKRNG